MAGGLLNLISYGNENIILNGNQQKFLNLHTQHTQITECKNLELIRQVIKNYNS